MVSGRLSRRETSSVGSSEPLATAVGRTLDTLAHEWARASSSGAGTRVVSVQTGWLQHWGTQVHALLLELVAGLRRAQASAIGYVGQANTPSTKQTQKFQHACTYAWPQQRSLLGVH